MAKINIIQFNMQHSLNATTELLNTVLTDKENTILIIDEADQVLTGNKALQLKPFILGVKQLIVASATYSDDSLTYLNELDVPLTNLIVEKRV